MILESYKQTKGPNKFEILAVWIVLGPLRMGLFRTLHWLPVCFQVQLKVWVTPLKPFVASARVIQRTPHPNGIGPLHLCWQRVQATDPVGQGISVGGEEPSLPSGTWCPPRGPLWPLWKAGRVGRCSLIRGPCSKGETCAHPPAELPSGPEGLGLPAGLGTQRGVPHSGDGYWVKKSPHLSRCALRSPPPPL